MQPTLYDVFQTAIAQAGYARVSTDHEEQATSYEAQMAYYRDYITKRDDWEFVGMYSDEGISATNIRLLTETVCDTSALASERDGLCGELDALSGSIERMVKENARTAMDQEVYREKEDRLCGIYAEKYERLQEVERLIEERNDKHAILTGVAEQLQTVEGGITEFDPQLWGGLVERVDVDKHAATVVFRGGIAIRV